MKKKKEVYYTVNKVKLTDQLQTEDSKNWLIAEGVKMLFDGKTPGKFMVTFLKDMDMITETC